VSEGGPGPGPGSAFFHHYIVIESPDLPISDGRVVFELAKAPEASMSGVMVPGTEYIQVVH